MTNAAVIGFFLCGADLISQSLSAFCASSLQNVSAVGSSHSLSEAVLLLSLTLFGLVSSEHGWHLLRYLIGNVNRAIATNAFTVTYIL